MSSICSWDRMCEISDNAYRIDKAHISMVRKMRYHHAWPSCLVIQWNPAKNMQPIESLQSCVPRYGMDVKRFHLLTNKDSLDEPFVNSPMKNLRLHTG